MGVLDIILAAFLAYGFYRGWKNGVFVEVASILAVIAAFYGAMHFSYLSADYLNQQLDWNETAIKIAAFILTFLTLLVGVHLLAKLLTKVANFAMLGLLNQIAGGIFGLVKAAIILGALLSFLERANQPLDLIAPEFFENSLLYEPIKEAGSLVFSGVLEPKSILDYNPF
ncbi:MAG: CvpA family protein [Robiginitalea sp.]|uniref:CvpA family protein n=1 Tax=Robiginitalea sp. TaxID=1902411 RepID=UPI003C731FA1